jgi:hypothetical protein
MSATSNQFPLRAEGYENQSPAIRAACATEWLALLLLVLVAGVTGCRPSGGINPEASAHDFIYTTNNGTITITRYTGPGGAVVIPSKIAGLPVTSIARFGFRSPTNLTSITIPNSVTSIGDSAFWERTSLTNASIPNSVTNIGRGAFYGCASLTSVSIPNGVARIRSLVFMHCKGLTHVTIPASVTNIAADAFHSCTRLTRVAIPNSVLGIGARAFRNCESLTNLTIGSSVTTIGEAAFVGCWRLPEVTIPKNVTHIQQRAFAGPWSKLSAINVDPFNPSYSSVDGVLFNKSQTTLIQCPGGKVGSYTVPNGVTNIGSDAFPCRCLTNITIPDSVASIATSAFHTCDGLQGLYFQGNAPLLAVPSQRNTSVRAFPRLPSDDSDENGPGIGSAWSPPAERALAGGTNRTVYYLPGTMGWGSTFGGCPAKLWKR